MTLRLICLISLLVSPLASFADSTLTCNPEGVNEPMSFNRRLITNDFHVSKTGTTKYPLETLLRLFELWKVQYLAPGDVPVNPPDTEPQMTKFSIFRVQPNNMYLILSDGTGEIQAFEAKSDFPFRAEQSAFIYWNNIGNYEYVDHKGITRRHKKFIEWTTNMNPAGNGLEQEDFVKILRDDKKMLVIYDVEEVKCFNCSGRGEYRGRPEKDKSQHPDKSYTCPQCFGGKERRPVRWQVKW